MGIRGNARNINNHNYYTAENFVMQNVYCVGSNSQFPTIAHAFRNAHKNIPQGETITIFLENEDHSLE